MEHIPTPDMDPSLNEVQQVDETDHVIPVFIKGPVETRELPSKRTNPRTVDVLDIAGSKLLSADPRRKFATIIARTNDIRIGATQSASMLTGSWLPNVVPFVVYGTGELWASGEGGDTEVSVIEEYWA